MTWIPNEEMDRLIRESRQAALTKQEIEALRWPDMYDPSLQPQAITVFLPALGGISQHAFTFASKEQARAMRDTLNGMTLEGDL